MESAVFDYWIVHAQCICFSVAFLNQPENLCLQICVRHTCTSSLDKQLANYFTKTMRVFVCVFLGVVPTQYSIQSSHLLPQEFDTPF